MSYDVAVWAGSRPADDEVAAAEFERFADLLEDDEPPAPSPAIRAFLDDLLTVLPALDESEDPRSPWAVGPEPGEVSGDFAYLTMTYSGAEAALGAVVEMAGRHGLVCFDPQDERLL